MPYDFVGSQLPKIYMVPTERLELPTYGLQNRCSTIEPCGLFKNGGVDNRNPVQCISTPIIITGLADFSLLALGRMEKISKYPPRSITNPHFNVLCCDQTKDGFSEHSS